MLISGLMMNILFLCLSSLNAVLWVYVNYQRKRKTLNYVQSINQNECCREKEDSEKQRVYCPSLMNDVRKVNIFARKGIREAIKRSFKRIAREEEAREIGWKRSSDSQTGYRYRCRAFSVRTLKQIRAKISAKWITMKTVDFIGGERKE